MKLFKVLINNEKIAREMPFYHMNVNLFVSCGNDVMKRKNELGNFSRKKNNLYQYIKIC